MSIPVVRYVKRDQRRQQPAGIAGQIDKTKSPEDRPETISAKSEIRPLRKAPLVSVPSEFTSRK